MDAAGRTFRKTPLDVSFRSTAAGAEPGGRRVRRPARRRRRRTSRRNCATTPTAPAMPAASSCGRCAPRRTKRSRSHGRCRSATTASVPRRSFWPSAWPTGSPTKPAAPCRLPAGPPARPRRRDGARAPAQRFRPRPGARAEDACHRRRRPRSAGADRPARGAGPDGAGRRAAAAAGRSRFCLPADQPARRPRRRRPDRAWRSAAAAPLWEALRDRAGERAALARGA